MSHTQVLTASSLIPQPQSWGQIAPGSTARLPALARTGGVRESGSNSKTTAGLPIHHKIRRLSLPDVPTDISQVSISMRTTSGNVPSRKLTFT